MMLRFAGFGGEARGPNPKMLAENLMTRSLNQKPGRGDFRPWRTPLTVETVPSGRKTIYRMGREIVSDSNYWLSWPTFVHACRGFEAENTTERTYFTGDGVPKVTDNIMALTSAPYPTAARILGLPAPATAMVAVAAGNGTATAQTEDVVYTYTYGNDWGWESAPGPAVALTKKTDETATLSGIAAPPSGNYGIDKIRIYKAESGNSTTSYFFHRELPIGTTSTTDDNRAIGEVLETMDWLPPPSDLKFLTPLWNGMFAGISGNSVRFCEPYVPYAWPIAYDVIPPDGTPVGLGVFGQNLLVLTTGRPLVVTGSSPEGADQQPLEFSQGCVSAESVVSMGAGVAWASNDGLCWFGAGGAKIITAGVMTREDWLALKPETIIGKMYEGLYFGSYNDGSGRKGFLIDPNGGGIYFLGAGYEAMHFDELQDQLYVLSGANIQRWDGGLTFMQALGRSKVFALPVPVNFGALEVLADTYPVTVAIEARGIDPAEVSAVIADRGVHTSPASGVLRYEVNVPSRAPVPLPGGFSAQDWQIEVLTGAAVLSVSVAQVIDELRSV